jgi:hypothetical protein
MDMQKLIEIAIRNAKSKYEYLAEGRNRMVFVKDDGFIIKIPKNDWGVSDNCSEERRFNKFGKTGDIIPYAQCRVINDENGIPLLEMERVYPLLDTDKKPSWSDYVDCAQIGRTLSGEIVAYDYSDVY